MGRANRGKGSHRSHNHLALRDPDPISSTLETLEVAEDLIRSIGLEGDQTIRDSVVREAIAVSLHDTERPSNEMHSGLEKTTRDIRLHSPLLVAVADDPRFRDDLKVMIDLDSTLFPLDGALREMGVHLRIRNSKSWEGGSSDLTDAIMRDRYGREDLCKKNLSPEEASERISLVVSFFAEMHSSADRMKNSGVFEYAPGMLQLLQAHGAEIHLFTHRDERSREATREWVEAMGIPYDSLSVEDPSRKESRSDKIEYCLDNGISLCVDDKPETIRSAEAAGIEALSLRWPYARDAIEEVGADAAGCWRELGEGIIRHMELAVIERAKREGVTLPENMLQEAEELHALEPPLRSQQKQ